MRLSDTVVVIRIKQAVCIQRLDSHQEVVTREDPGESPGRPL